VPPSEGGPYKQQFLLAGARAKLMLKGILMHLSSISFIRLPLVKQRTGLSRSSIYAKIALDEFPAPVNLGPRSVGWVDSEIDQWIADRVVASRGSEASR